MKTLVSLAVLSALMSCGPAPELKRRAFLMSTDKQIEVAALTEKSDQEIIQLKYNGSVPLKCEFKIMEGSNVDLDKFKGWESSLELAKNEIQHKPFDFKFNGGRTISVSIMIDSFAIDRTTKPHEVDGTIYEMSFSPSAMITVKITESANGEVKGVKTIQKKIIEQVTEEIKGFDLGNDISQDLRCSLATKIDEKYSKQWKKKGRKEVSSPAPEIVVND